MKSRRSKIKKDKDRNQVSYTLECSFLENGSINSALLKIAVFSLIVIFNWFQLSAIDGTFAYFNDIENSPGNTYTAGVLDFSLTHTNIEEFLGIELGEDIEFISIATKVTGSMGIQYKVHAEKIDGNDDFCDLLKLEVSHSVVSYDDLLLSFDTVPTTALGTWAFEIKLPYGANIPHGQECNVDLVFEGWRDDVVDFNQGGFTDEERIHLNLTSRMIVLNEFLPNPDESAWGLDFGDDNDLMPNGEWVELYNNSNMDYDLDGWYIWDASADDSNKVLIGAIIPGNSWLVVYMNKEILDNTSDTVSLFDENDVLVDSYDYAGDSDYCELEPTPGDENTTDTTGDCGGVPPNKSYARIPDGIGSWVDPIPTPGGPNILESFEYPEAEITEPEPEIIVELPDIDIIETTTPALEEVIVIEEEPIIEEEIVEEDIVVNLPNIDIIETTTPSTEEVIIIKEPVVEEQKLVIKEPEPLSAEASSGAEEEEPEPELDNIEEDAE